MAHSYLKEALVSTKYTLGQWAAENTGNGVGRGLGPEILDLTLGGFRQSRQIENNKALLMIEHITHLGSSVQDGRTRSSHDMRIHARMGNVTTMAKLIDTIYDRMQNYSETRVTDTVNTRTLDVRYYPESVGLDYQFEDEYVAYLNFRIEITEV